MLRILPGWWMAFMEWLDHSTVPVMVILCVVTFYFLWAFWRDIRVMHNDVQDSE